VATGETPMLLPVHTPLEGFVSVMLGGAPNATPACEASVKSTMNAATTAALVRAFHAIGRSPSGRR
jgi:hypothetical protein